MPGQIIVNIVNEYIHILTQLFASIIVDRWLSQNLGTGYLKIGKNDRLIIGKAHREIWADKIKRSNI